MMLSKVKCTDAISSWDAVRSDYSKIETLFPHGWVFNLSKSDCQWINTYNKFRHFHAYIGIYENQLVLIVIPLDEQGKELPLDSYLSCPLSTMQNPLTVIEKDTVVTKKTTLLSAALEVTGYNETIEMPTHNEPDIDERASVTDIEKWKNNYLDWFYNECSSYKGKRIFKVFTVPFADLLKDGEYDEVVVSFAFKTSSIYQRDIAVLIFIAVNTETQHSKIIRKSSVSTESNTNTKDYSQPCPPMCRFEKSFGMIGQQE